MTDQLTQQEVNNTAWAACDTFRGVIDPAQYKDYILVMLFPKLHQRDQWARPLRRGTRRNTATTRSASAASWSVSDSSCPTLSSRTKKPARSPTAFWLTFTRCTSGARQPISVS